MTDPNPATCVEETDADRRRRIVSDGGLSLDLVSAFAGDRALDPGEKQRLEDAKKIRGGRFFSDLLYSMTHLYFSPERAESLWDKIIQHKHSLSGMLGRNVGVAVAALDYLSNITDKMGSATLAGEAYIEEIVGLSFRDGLTGLFNHTYFYQQVDLEVRRHRRYGGNLSLALIDVDDFKAVNDTYGHREGDRILAAMGDTLVRAARDSDICCRYGGEEFVVILPMTDTQKAVTLADRLRIELQEHLPDGETVTVSVGVASCGKDTASYRDLVEKADTALYRAKRSGKNRVAVGAEGDTAADRGVVDRR